METPGCYTIFSELLRCLLLLLLQLLYRKSKFSNTFWVWVPNISWYLCSSSNMPCLKNKQTKTKFLFETTWRFVYSITYLLLSTFIGYQDFCLKKKSFKMSYISDLVSALLFTTFCFTVCILCHISCIMISTFSLYCSKFVGTQHIVFCFIFFFCYFCLFISFSVSYIPSFCSFFFFFLFWEKKKEKKKA